MMKCFTLAVLLLLSISVSIEAKTYVVCAGISHYKFINSLKLPDKDAQAVNDLYQKNGAECTLLLDREATKTNILSKMRLLFAKAGQNDQIVLFFSGHGYPGGICPYDSKNTSTSISYQELRSILKDSKARQKIIIADACFSGGLRSGGKKSNVKVSEDDGDKSVVLFLSSRAGETSIESTQMVNGFFTTFLLRGLKGGADANLDRCISAKEIFTFVSDGVKNISRNSQHPVMWGKFDDNFIIMDWR